MDGYKCNMGWGMISMGWETWEAEYAHGICTPLPFLCCPACKKFEMKIVSKDSRENKIEKKSSLSG